MSEVRAEVKVQSAKCKVVLAAVVLLAGIALGQEMVLIPMDLTQADHLKAYGVAHRLLQRGGKVEWLLNYRGGSFLFPSDVATTNDCKLSGVSYQPVSAGDVVQIRTTIEASNMETVMLERATRLAVYAPPTADPWDDAVRLTLDYAGIKYDMVWDDEVAAGKLKDYDWLHLHHEDFTGQFGKFYAGYRQEEWYQREVAVNLASAAKHGYKKVSRLKLAMVELIRQYVADGGMLFGMCSATDTPDIAWAARNTDICAPIFDGDPIDPNYAAKLDFSGTFAFEDFTLVSDPLTYEHSNIDTYLEATARGQDVYFALFDFSAKYDPVPTMLVQNHVGLVKEFLGQNCGFRRTVLKKDVLVMGEVVNSEEVKYIHGNFGKGTFTFLGGHDPEDFAHRIGDRPTEPALHKNSPGYRLILNNVLFPAAEKKQLKT